MKTVIKKLLPIILIFATLFTLSGCGDKEWKTYKEGEFVYTLPRTMKKLSVPAEYADIVFGNSDGAEFCLFFYTPDQLFDTPISLDKQCTTEEYADKYFSLMDGLKIYTGLVRTYDPETDVTVQTYIYEPENLFFYDYIIRNENVLVHVWMVVDADLREQYEPIFADWASRCYLK